MTNNNQSFAQLAEKANACARAFCCYAERKDLNARQIQYAVRLAALFDEQHFLFIALAEEEKAVSRAL